MIVNRRISCRIGLGPRAVDGLSDGHMFAYFMIQVRAERETLSARAKVCTFIVEITDGHKQICLLAAMGDARVVLLLNAGTVHHIHPVGVGQLADRTHAHRGQGGTRSPRVAGTYPVLGAQEI